MANAQVRLHLREFHGDKGPADVQSFLNEVASLMASAGLTDAKMVGIIANSLRGAAAKWLEVTKLEEADKCASWATLKPLFTERFVRRMTTDEIRKQRESLRQQPGESAAALLDRCRLAAIQEDAHVDDEDTKTSAPFIYARTIKIRQYFLEGLKKDIRKAMALPNLADAAIKELLAAASTAEMYIGDSGPSTSVAALDAAPSEPKQSAELADIEKRLAAMGFQRGRRGGRDRGRGRSSRGGGGGGGGRGGLQRWPSKTRDGRSMPSIETLKNRQKAKCGRCGKEAKHRENECFVDLAEKRQVNAMATGGYPSSSSSSSFFYEDQYLN